MSTLIASQHLSTHYTFYHVVLVKFYCNVITIRRLQLINTSINTFFSKLRAFLAEQKRRRKASDGYKEARRRNGGIFSGSKNS